MRSVCIVLVITLLTGCAHMSVGTGPIWAVWTHSEKQEECIVKTCFWVALTAVMFGYTAYRINKYLEKKRK